MSNAGIDYGRIGQTNRNTETGIHYGVIQINRHDGLSQAWSDSSEGDYGEPACPVCGNKVVDYESADEAHDHENYAQYGDRGCADYACDSCSFTLDSSDCFSAEAISFDYTDKDVDASTCFDQSCLMVTRSPYFTRARFCSPCAPGAGDLDNPDEGGAETYCLGHDWFEGGAPYPVYSVETRELVTKESAS